MIPKRNAPNPLMPNQNFKLRSQSYKIEYPPSIMQTAPVT
jgi:hypothetical protein